MQFPESHPAPPAVAGRATSRRAPSAILFGLGLACGLATGAAAEEAPAPAQWQFYVTPYLWAAGVSGTATTPLPSVPSQDIQASFGDVLQNLHALPLMGAFEARNGKLGLLADFMLLSLKADVTTRTPLFNGGTSQLHQFNATTLGMIRVGETASATFDLGLGFRPWAVNTKLSLNGGALPGFSKSVSANWLDPLLAARVHFDVTEKFGVTGYGDIGGFGVGSDLTWQLMGTVDYRWNDWLMLRLGYRHMQIDYRRDGLMRLNLGLSGPILGATMRF